jgi:hypothetical protein
MANNPEEVDINVSVTGISTYEILTHVCLLRKGLQHIVSQIDDPDSIDYLDLNINVKRKEKCDQ